jgi:multiple sugar transport system substrate-binding protein
MAISRRHLIAGSALGLPTLSLAMRGTSALAQDKVTLDFPYLWTGPEGEALQKIVDEFNASQSEIEVKGVSNPDMQRMLAQMSASNGFDISDAFDSNIGSWASANAIMPLDDLISGAGYDTSDFVPSVMERMKFNDQIYAMPIAVHTILLMYNETLLEEAGVTPPKTTEELKTAIEALTKVDDDGRITQLGMNTPDFISFAYSFGGQWIDENLQPTANHEGNVEAFTFWVENASPQNPFYTGKVAMVPDGEWQARFIQQYAPDLKWSASYMPVPEAKPELEQTAALSASMFFIPANCSDPEAAWTFMEHLVSEGPMRDFTIALANLPTRSSLLEDAAYAEIPGLNYWLDSLTSENLKFMPATSWGNEYATEITSTVEDIVNLNKEPQEALDELQEKALGLAE